MYFYMLIYMTCISLPQGSFESVPHSPIFILDPALMSIIRQHFNYAQQEREGKRFRF